jgi:hypothetical protein
MPPTVKQWLKTSFKSSSSSFSMRKLDDDGMDESFSASEEDTVSLYEDSVSGGAVSYNFSPIEHDQHAADDSVSSGNDRPQQLQQHQPPSLSAMLSELQSDVAPTSSIMTEIVLSLSNIDMGRDWSTQTVFATAVDSFDEASDSKMHLLSFEDEKGDSSAFSKVDGKVDADPKEAGDENVVFAEWRSCASHKDRPARSPRHSKATTTRCRKSTKLGSMDPVYVYDARQELNNSTERKNSVEYHLGKHDNSAVSARKEGHPTDDCTLSSAETALVSNRSSDNVKRDLRMKQQRGCARASVVAKKKMQLSRKSRWMTAFRNPKYLTGSVALSAVSEEYYDS